MEDREKTENTATDTNNTATDSRDILEETIENNIEELKEEGRLLDNSAEAEDADGENVSDTDTETEEQTENVSDTVNEQIDEVANKSDTAESVLDTSEETEEQSEETESASETDNTQSETTSEQSSTQSNKTKKHKTGNKKVAIALGCMAVAFGIGGAVIYSNSANKNSTADTAETAEAVEEEKSGTAQIREAINNVYATGGMLNAQVDTDMYITYIYDKQGRPYIETPYTVALFVDSNKILTAHKNDKEEPEFVFETESHPLGIIENMCNMVDTGKASITGTKEDGISIYNMSTSGSDIYEMFKTVGDEYANSQLDMFDVKSADELTTSDRVNIRVAVDDSNNNMDAQTEIHKANDNNDYTLFAFNGYIGIGEWELDKEQFNTDMDLSDFGKVSEKINNVQSMLANSIQKYIDEHQELQKEVETATEAQSETATDSTETDNTVTATDNTETTDNTAEESTETVAEESTTETVATAQ